jgi:hypothetical protein
MAVKKSSATKKKAPAKKVVAVKKTVTKKKAPAKKATKSTGAKTAPKAVKKSTAPKAKKTAVKLSDTQAAFLKTIKGHGEAGYPNTKKGEVKSLDSLRDKKLVKKGSKNKATGAVHYHVTKAGEKHLASGSTASPTSNGMGSSPSL